MINGQLGGIIGNQVGPPEGMGPDAKPEKQQ